MNKIVVNGLLTKEDKKYNQNQVYTLAVERKSGIIDNLLVLSEEEELPEGPVHMEGRLHAEYIYDVGVPLTIVPEVVEPGEADGFSESKLIGKLMDKPKCRRTKNGKAITSVLLKTKDGPIPVLLWGSNAIKAEQELKRGDSIKVAGRLQSRQYPDKHRNLHMTYELSANVLEYNF